MHHIRLDLHAFTELCESIRRKEAVMLLGADLKDGKTTRIYVPAEAMAQLSFAEGDSSRLPTAITLPQTPA